MKRAAKVAESFVLQKCDYFVDVGLWPLYANLNPRGWLSNFLPSERDHAVHLLNAFIYYSEDLVNQLFKAAFNSLASKAVFPKGSPAATRDEWRAFCRAVIITYVEGETPSVTDSGYAFARKARQQLGIPEARILSPGAALKRVIDSGPQPVVFVDDFIGSGDQFTRTWERPLVGTASFASTTATIPFPAFYCTLVATEWGHARITTDCPRVSVAAAHVVGEEYSAFSPTSVLWPDYLAADAEAFLKGASIRAGIPATGPKGWRGYKNLGLAVAFSHSVPDATLPIFYWPHSGWVPLLRRT